MPVDPLTPEENAALRKLLMEREAWGVLWKIALALGGAAVGLAVIWGNLHTGKS